MREISIDIMRGTNVESRHQVDAVVMNAQGEIVDTYGDPQIPIYPRSMIKPAQAIQFVLSGAQDRSPNSTKAIAMACASHASEHLHLDFLRSWWKSLNIDESNLACGPQRPSDDAVFFELVRAHKSPSRINNNCSGKHTAMIATCIARDLPVKGYELWYHPIQQEIRKTLTELSGIDHEKVPWAIDGCGIPTYLIPLENSARMMSAFLAPEEQTESVARAMKLIRDACTSQPYMVGGHNWLCSETTAATRGRVFAKVGAEGVYVGLDYDQKSAIVLKARDGSRRAADAALVTLLDRYTKLSFDEKEKIHEVGLAPLKNWSGTTVGSVRVKID